MNKDQTLKNENRIHIYQYFKSILMETSKSLATLFNFNYFGINLIDKKDNSTEKLICCGDWSEDKNKQEKLQTDTCQKVMKSGKVVTNRDKSILCVPIKIMGIKEGQEKILGTVFLHSPSPSNYSIISRGIIVSLVNVLAFGIWNVKYELNKRSIREFGDIGITSLSVNLQAAIYDLLEKIIETFNAQTATVYRYDKKNHRFFYPIAKGVSKQFWAQIPRKDGVAAHTVQSPDPLFLNDVSDNDLFSQSSFTKNEKVKSAAAASLGGEGVLFLSYRQKHEFTNDEEQEFKLFAKVLEAVFYSLNTVENLKWEGEISEKEHFSETMKSFFKEKLIGSTMIDIVTLYAYDNHKRNFYLVAGEGTDMRYTAGRPISSNLGEKILKEKEPFFFEKVKGTFLEKSHFVQREKIKTAAIFPLRNRSSECVGILFVNYREFRKFDNEVKKRLTHLSNFLTIILMAVLRETDLNRTVKILKKFHDATDEEKTKNINSILQEITDGISYITKADLVMILMPKQKTPEFFIGGLYGIEQTYINEKIPLKIGQEVLNKKREVNIDDLEHRYPNNILFTKAGIRTLSCIPLIHTEDIVGLLYIGFKSKAHVLSESERQVVELLVGEASQRIGNFLSTLQINQKQKQLESLLDISKIIHPLNSNLEQTLKKVTQIITKKLGYKRGIVSLKEMLDGKNHFKRVAFVGLAPKAKKELSQKSSWNTEEQIKKIFKKEFKISRSYYISHKYKEEVKKSVTSVYRGDPDENRKDWEWHPEDMLLIPLRKRNEIIGLLSVDTPLDKSVPTEESVKTLEVFAEHLVLAIDNALKYERRIKELAGLRAVERIIKTRIENEDVEAFVQSVLNSIIEQSTKTIEHIEYANIYLRENNHLVKKAKHIPDPLKYRGGDRITIDEKQSIVAKVAREKKSLVINNLNEKKWKDIYYQTYLGMQSELTVPIKQKNNIIGVINVESPQTGAFNDDDKNYLEMLADQSFNALQQTIPYAQREERLKEYNILDSVEQKTGSSWDIEEIAKHTLEVVVQSARSETGNITLWHKSTGELELLALYDRKIIQKRERYKGRGITIMAAERKKELYIPNLDVKCPCCPGGTWRDNHYHLVWGDSVSELAVPIIYNETVFGVLNLESANFDAFEDHIPFIKFVARQLGRAIDQARQYEEKLLEEQGRAQRNLWSFLGQTMVHEFAKKLSTIRGNETILKDIIEGETLQELLENNEKVISDMLYELTRLPEETSMEKFEIHGVLNEIVNECRTYRDYHGDIKISTEFGAESILEANKKCLHIIIANLIENAFTAMPDGGFLTIITRKLQNQTEIVIKDTGVGIPDDLKKNLFKSPLKSKRGMGIFLVISKSLINSFKGDIELIESQKNKGTIIRLWLPNVG
ncbi:MAG: GAF domain-containing protein [Candidatus Aminicenantes bacterium]|jgi:GAF domain-containing protein